MLWSPRRAKQARYLAIEPSGEHLDSIETQLAKVLSTRNFTFLKHHITDVLPTLKGRTFDLVLLANVLYYVPNSSDGVWKHVVQKVHDQVVKRGRIELCATVQAVRRLD